MKKPKQIAIVDVDEILWGFNDALRTCALSHGYGFPTIEQCTHWNSVYEFIPKPEAIKLFDEVHEHQCEYAPFPDAKGFLKFMKKHFWVVIASHRSPDHMPQLREWLYKNSLDYNMIDVSFDKTRLFKNPNVKVVVDDRDETLRIAMDAGLVALGLRRPWNQNSKDRDYLLFESLPEIEEYIKKNVLRGK
jgi:hypothetical protein